MFEGLNVIFNQNVIIISFFYFFFIISTNAIRYPITPQEPSSPTVESTGDSTTSPHSKKPKDEKITIRVKVFLGSGDELNGFIQAPKELKFKHYRNGFIYRKKIFTNDISLLEIASFQKNLIRTKKPRKFYEFKPSLIKISMKNKKKFRLNYLFKFLYEFNIQTSNGTTTLYSFFADEFHKIKGWSEVSSKDDTYHKTNPHPQSIQKIWFFGAMSEE